MRVLITNCVIVTALCWALFKAAQSEKMQLLSKKVTAGRVGIHPESLMRLSREGKFPKPIKLGDAEQSAVRFIETEVEDWIAARMAARD